MTRENEYTSFSLHVDLKAGFESMKHGDETNNDVARRALVALREKEDKQQSQREWDEARRREQDRVLVRIADKVGLEPEEIPDHMIDEESRGDAMEQADDPLNGIFTPRDESNEATLDLNKQQRQTANELRSKARNRIIEQRKERGEFERPGDNPPRQMVGADQMQRAMLEIIEENPGKWAAAADELADEGDLDEPDEGWTDSFENNEER